MQSRLSETQSDWRRFWVERLVVHPTDATSLRCTAALYIPTLCLTTYFVKFFVHCSLWPILNLPRRQWLTVLQRAPWEKFFFEQSNCGSHYLTISGLVVVAQRRVAVLHQFIDDKITAVYEMIAYVQNAVEKLVWQHSLLNFIWYLSSVNRIRLAEYRWNCCMHRHNYITDAYNYISMSRQLICVPVRILKAFITVYDYKQ